MKNSKKEPSKQLEKFSNIFTQLGLVLVLFIVFVFLEHQTPKTTTAEFSLDTNATVYVNPDTEVFFTKETKPVVTQKIEKTIPFIVDEIQKGEDTFLETVIDISPEKTPTLINMDDIVEITDKPEIIEDVPFVYVQNAPVFKGCESLSKEENKKCFDKKMQQFMQRNFNGDIANQLGLQSGIHKIQTQFIIDTFGNVVEVKIKAPHKKLQSEIQRVIQKLPKFTPGKQNNKTVKVRYTLPISFRVE